MADLGEVKRTRRGQQEEKGLLASVYSGFLLDQKATPIKECFRDPSAVFSTLTNFLFAFSLLLHLYALPDTTSGPEE